MPNLSPQIAEVVVDLPVDGPFDYLIPVDFRADIKLGQRVRIIFNRKKMMGVVVGFREKSKFPKLSSIISILDEGVCFSASALELSRKMSDYYGCSMGEALAIQLPQPLRTDRAVECPVIETKRIETSNLPVILSSLNYQARLNALKEEIKKCFEEKHQVLFLVPEVAQLGFLENKLHALFPSEKITAIRHPMGVKDEINLWQSIRKGEIDLVLGTRSAVFLPLPRLGLIIIWNEQNPAYKEEQSPHYHANEVAMMRHKVEGCRVVLTSPVTGSEWFYRQKKKEVEIKHIKDDHLAKMKLVDMTNYNPQRSSILSYPLQRDIEKVRKENGKVWFILLPQDFTPYFSQELNREIRPKAEKIIDELKRFYPNAKVGRYEESISANVDMALTAPHALAFDYPVKPALIAVINADRHLRRVDFRSAYYLYSLLMRLRSLASQTVVVQTQMRDYFPIHAAIKDNEKIFYRDDLIERKELNLPPFKHLVEVTFRGKNEKDVQSLARECFNLLSEKKPKSVILSDPYTSTTQNLKLQQKVRYSIMLKGPSVEPIVKYIKKSLTHYKKKSDVIMTINVNP